VRLGAIQEGPFLNQHGNWQLNLYQHAAGDMYLENGFHIHKTPYGDGVAIEDTDGLHNVIGRWLVRLPKPINGAELRFLRIEIDTTQRRLAGIIGTTKQTLRLLGKA
jgi:putative transcriptional regulator